MNTHEPVKRPEYYAGDGNRRMIDIMIGFFVTVGVVACQIFAGFILMYAKEFPLILPWAIAVVDVALAVGLLFTRRRFIGVGALLAMGVGVLAVGGCFALILLNK